MSEEVLSYVNGAKEGMPFAFAVEITFVVAWALIIGT